MTRAAALFALVVLTSPAALLAQEENRLPLDVEIPQALVVGQDQPFLKLQARADVQSVRVTVSRKGWQRQFRVGSLGAGQDQTFRWTERPGVYGYSAKVQATREGVVSSQSFTWELSYLQPISMSLSRERVDLAKRQLTFRLNHPADRAEVVVQGPQGVELTRAEQSYDGARPGTDLTIAWPPVEDEVTRVEVTAYGTAGYWTGMAIVPWSVEIPHEEVEFETDQWEVRPSEAPKLDRAIELIHKALAEHGAEFAVNLYVAGFTDTVGPAAHNRDLSQKRARAIAQYFAAHEVTIPISYRGFGEEVLAVETGDEAAEPRNRRALYILASQPPTLSETVRWGGWQGLGGGR